MKALLSFNFRFYASFLINALLVLIEILAAVREIRSQGAGFFRYYTFDSNFLTGIISLLFCICTGICGRNMPVPAAVSYLRFISSSMLMLTFIVVVTMLAPHKKENGFRDLLFTGTDKYVHLICPWLSFFSLVLLERPVLEFSAVLYALIPTALYALVLIVLNITGRTEGPYFFLKVHKQSFGRSVFYFLVIFSADFLISLILWVLL